MATSEDQRLFQCSTCQSELGIESKTLTCLHSLCSQCFDKEFQEETSRNGQCPECQEIVEIVEIDQLTLSPFLLSSLKCRQMESSELKCDMCLRDEKESIAANWCNNCVQFFCEECNLFHKKLPQKQHNSIKLDEHGKDKILKFIMTDNCKIHNKMKESYCHRCNVCLCDTCYTIHLKYSPQCPSCPISVIEEALKKQNFQGPILLEKISVLENNLRERNKKCRIYSEQLERECYLKCEDIWLNYKEILNELKEKMCEMCDELKKLKNEQVKNWRQLMDENENMLKKLEIWRINLRHLLKKDQKKTDIVCGIELVGMKLASLSSSHQLHQKINEPVRKCQLVVKYSNYWLQFLEGVKNQMIGSGSLNFSGNLIQFEKELNLPGSNTYSIQSIIVSQEDNHIFLADRSNNSIIELTESGELISKCLLIHKGNKLYPREMFFNSSEILGVICSGWGQEKLFFLEREKYSPFLKIKKIIDTKKRNSVSCSVCQLKKTILICDWNFQIDVYTKTGEYIKTIDTRESGGDSPLIRADPSTGNFWGVLPNTCKILYFNENGEKIQSFETEENILNFFINEFGHFYFFNLDGIFSFFPENNLHTYLHKFKKTSRKWPIIFVSSEKIFVCLQIDKKYLIQIFKFLD